MDVIDLNCDVGESFGAWTMGSAAEMVKIVSSANIACGFHGNLVSCKLPGAVLCTTPSKRDSVCRQ